MNDGLATIQFQSVSLHPDDPTTDAMGGTQDNGTWLFSGGPEWLETIDGDGGQVGIRAEDPTIRVHTYFDATPDVSFDDGARQLELDRDLLEKSNELRSFYVPLITDPVVGGSMFVGMESVWRTTDNGGPQAFLEETATSTRARSSTCAATGSHSVPGTAEPDVAYGRDKAGHYVVAVERPPETPARCGPARASAGCSSRRTPTRPGRT